MVGVARFAGIAVLALSMLGPAAAEPALEKLDIVTASGPHAFEVEVMRTDPDRERGLMFRKHMDADHGMLFDFERATPVNMWMKNTYIPLDMVFIGPDGRIVSVAEDAEPMSERIISSHGSVLGVLEVNAGTVQKLGVRPGDRVENAMFPR